MQDQNKILEVKNNVTRLKMLMMCLWAELKTKTKQSIKEHWGSSKLCNICVIGLPEEKKENSRKNIWSNNG